MHNLPPITHFIGPTPMEKWISGLNKYARIPFRFSMHDFFLRFYQKSNGEPNTRNDQVPDILWDMYNLAPRRPHCSHIIKPRIYTPSANEYLFATLGAVLGTPGKSVSFHAPSLDKAEELFIQTKQAYKKLMDLLKIPKESFTGYIPMIMTQTGSKSSLSSAAWLAKIDHLAADRGIIIHTEMSREEYERRFKKLFKPDPIPYTISRIEPTEGIHHFKNKPKPWESNFDNRGGKKNKRNRKY